MAEKQEEKKDTTVEELIKTMSESYEKKIQELIDAHKKDMEELKKQVSEQKEESKKIVQSVISGHFEAKKEDEGKSEDEEDDPEDMSADAIEKRTVHELAKKLKLQSIFNKNKQ